MCTLTHTHTGNENKIVIQGTSKGLGIRIVGGRNVPVSDQMSTFGIFVKEVITGSLAEKDGMYHQGEREEKSLFVSY